MIAAVNNTYLSGEAEFGPMGMLVIEYLQFGEKNIFRSLLSILVSGKASTMHLYKTEMPWGLDRFEIELPFNIFNIFIAKGIAD